MNSVHHFLNLVVRIRNLLASTIKFLFERVSAYKWYFLRAILIGLVISLAVTIQAWLGYFKPYQNPLSNLLHLMTPKRANDVVLLFITEEEYKQGFHGVSPLSRGRLGDLVNLMVKLKSRVIALDIDLSDLSTEDRILSDAFGRASAAGIPVVVVGNLKTVEKTSSGGDDSIPNSRPYRDESLQTTEDHVLLFEDMSPGSQWIGHVSYGGTFFRLDNDGVFRMAEVLYKIKNKDLTYDLPHLPAPSFPIAVAAAYQGMSQKAVMESILKIHDGKLILPNPTNGHRDDIWIHMVGEGRMIPNFIGNYEHFDHEVNLKDLLEEYRSDRIERKTIFTDKIVIIGGTFDKRDFCMTPVGRMSGMEIIANITQSIISGSLITPTSFWKAFVIQVMLGIAVALIFVFFSRSWATIICLLGLIPGVVIASLWSFSSSHYWFDFVPAVAGVMLYGRIRKVEQFIRKVKHRFRKRLGENEEVAKRPLGNEMPWKG